LDITNYLIVGENKISLIATVGDITETLHTTINVVNLTLTTSFDENQLITDSTFTYVYSLKGSVNKKIYFQIDKNTPIEKSYGATQNATNASIELPTDGLEHGVHSLSV
jgi:hypothetical protein